MSDLVGRRLGPYDLLEVMRSRRTSTTYRAARESGLVAVTLLPAMEDPSDATAVLAEARAVARLRHPNILPIEDIGQDGGHVYIVHAFAGPTPTLADNVGEAMDPSRAVGLITTIAGALAHAHAHGVIHGDVTPRHIGLPSPMWPMLTDFVIGRGLHAAAAEPGPRIVIGTPAYIAPERAFGLPGDSRSDLYSIAVILYQLLVGRVPFDGDTPQAILRRQAYEPPSSLRRFRQDLPAALDHTVLRALAKEPDDRQESADELAAELSSALGNGAPGPSQAASDRAPQPTAPPDATGLAFDPLASDYAAGVDAFASGQWDAAVVALGRVAESDSDYEDVEALLRAAHEALDPAGNE